MTATSKRVFKPMLAALCLALAAGQVLAATDVSGVKYEDSVTIAGKKLLLNGAGVRSKSVIKVYTAGLYLEDAKGTLADVLKAEGPRRMRLVMLRDIPSEDLGSAFITALGENVSLDDKSKIVTQISKYGELFSQVHMLKKGDTIDTDWIPGVGNQCYLNGKKIGAPIPDLLFYNAVLRIWLGDKPVDATLKDKLLKAAKK